MAIVTRAVHAANIDSKLADNTTRAITALKHRELSTDMLDSAAVRVVGGSDPASAPEARGDVAVNTATEDVFVAVDTAAASDWEKIAKLSFLAGTGGAAAIGILDAAGNFAATTVEAALAELYGLGGGAGFTQEQIEDLVGAMVSGNTESLITVTYQDTDGTFDFAVNSDLAAYDNSTAQFISATAVGVTVQPFDVDTLKADVSDNLTVGFTSSTSNQGTKSSGTFTPDPTVSNFQHYINGGAHTLAPPASNCAISILITNNASAGTITTSGFTVAPKGDAFTLTNAHKFMCTITVNNGNSVLSVAALQ